MADQVRGGLGINSLKAQNLSLLSKWWGRFKTTSSSLWKDAITGIHGPSGGIPSTLSGTHSNIGGVWGAITGIHKKLSKFNINLPALFNYSSTASNEIITGRWTWLLDTSGSYTAASLRAAIDSAMSQNTLGLKTLWYPSIPSKVNILAWRIQHHRLPTRVNLDYRGIDIGTALCPMCDTDVETEDHLFLGCSSTKMALRAIFSWWGLAFLMVWSIDDMFGDNLFGLSGQKLSCFRAVMFVHFWLIWNARNEWVFTKKKELWTSIHGRVQAQSFFWINSRRNKRRKMQ